MGVWFTLSIQDLISAEKPPHPLHHTCIEQGRVHRHRDAGGDDGLIPAHVSTTAELTASQSTGYGAGSRASFPESWSSPLASGSSTGRRDVAPSLRWPRHIFGTCTLVVTYDNELMAS